MLPGLHKDLQTLSTKTLIAFRFWEGVSFMVTQDQLLPLLNDSRLSARVKLEDYLLVVLGVRQCGQLLIPGEMPDARELMESIDRSYSQKYFEGSNPRSGPIGSFFDTIKYGFYRAAMNPLEYKATLIRETLDELLVESENYRAHREWANRLGLDTYESNVRPSINEFFVFSPGQLDHLQRLARLRREERERTDASEVPSGAVIFPEQHCEEFVTGLGRVLGYPECCTERYAADRTSGVIPEVRGAEQLEEVSAETRNQHLPAYFARGFVPCSPMCSSALARGETAVGAFKETDRQRLVPRYEAALESNRKYIERYPELLREHQERLSGELAETHIQERDRYD
jgi:hypothetical protein